MLDDHYMVLGVPPSATKDEIHAAYIALAKRHHPDTNGLVHAEKFKQITASYGVLKDKASKSKYDAERRLLVSPCATCKGSGVRQLQMGLGRVHKRSCTSCNGTGRAAKKGGL